MLDVDEARQKLLPKGSIHFDNFNGQTVLAITGNYYISYSSDVVSSNQRARRTYEDVVLPILKAVVTGSIATFLLMVMLLKLHTTCAARY